MVETPHFALHSLMLLHAIFLLGLFCLEFHMLIPSNSSLLVQEALFGIDTLTFTTFLYAQITTSVINPTVIPGTIHLEPISGIALDTQFTLLAKDWRDSRDDNLELEFRFGYQIAGGYIQYLTHWLPIDKWIGVPSGGK